MMKIGFAICMTIVFLVGPAVHSRAQSAAAYSPFSHGQEQAPVQIASLQGGASEEEDEPAAPQEEIVPDPLEPVNRAFFEFNDKLYFWVMKPVATGYKAVVPEEARVCVRNFFHNLASPVRVVNNLLQGKFFGAFEETCGFLVNSTVGLGGFADIASAVDLRRHEEDFGQTLSVYGSGPAFFINWPFLGPSTLRDTVGMAGDILFDPVTYLGTYWYAPWARGLNVVNETSLKIGDYESLKKAALDPYVALRDAYYQNRLSKIQE
ncbi:MAG: VacJ family lipoprotein [Deltaproteobacteria bacterium]